MRTRTSGEKHGQAHCQIAQRILKGLMRIRHYGSPANRRRRQRMAQIRESIEIGKTEQKVEPGNHTDLPFDGWPCPKCHQGYLRLIELRPNPLEWRQRKRIEQTLTAGTDP